MKTQDGAPGGKKQSIWTRPPSKWWITFLRILIVLLCLLLAVALYFSFNPAAMANLLLKNSVVVPMPNFGPTPSAPQIDAPPGEPPSGPLAMWGQTDLSAFSCSFVMQVPDGPRVIVATAHATYPMAMPVSGRLTEVGGAVVARLSGQLGYGTPFRGNRLDEDFSIWRVEGQVADESVLIPDPRGLPQPGERIRLFNYARQSTREGGWVGTVLLADEHAVWVRYDDSFDVNVNSGCPVVSLHTGKLIGMVIAGEDRHPVIMGLHPVSALMKKAQDAVR